MTRSAYATIMAQIASAAKASGRDPGEISLLAVTKGVPWDQAKWIYAEGQRLYGENRIVEALAKKESAPKDCQWHLIGTLQSNKIRKAVGQFALIHSIDSFELAEKISQVSFELGLQTPILLEANTSGEPNKHGLPTEEWKRSFDKVRGLKGIVVKGFMTMAPLVDDETVIRRCFASLRQLRDALDPSLKELSMGMSHDFPLAIAEGATIVRIGTALFKG